MTQFAQVTSDSINVVSGSGSAGAWIVQPFSGATTIAEALSTTSGRRASTVFAGDGTNFMDYTGPLAPLSYPLAGNHDLRIIYTVTPDGDGDCFLKNTDDDSVVYHIGFTNDGVTKDLTFTLSAGEVASIHDYANLYIHLYAADDAGTGFGELVSVTYVGFTIPNADPAGPPSGPFYGTYADFDPCLHIKSWF
jgi:hypothetical protein